MFFVHAVKMSVIVLTERFLVIHFRGGFDPREFEKLYRLLLHDHTSAAIRSSVTSIQINDWEAVAINHLCDRLTGKFWTKK